MIKKSFLAGLLALAFGAGLSLLACGSSSPTESENPPQTDRVKAVLVGSASEVVTGPPGAYFVSEDGKHFHLRCPGGSCTKSAVLPLVSGEGPYVWQLSGPPGSPTLSPSIHWFETNGVTTHWHGWLRNGIFEE